jgi:hypothetical protein
MRDAMPNFERIWDDDVLDRKSDVRYLQNYLSKRYLAKSEERGFVLAVNAEWGYGKSFMLERWKDQILAQGYPAVFFDAWQNDFTSDPLLAFIAELDSGLQLYFDSVPKAEKLKIAALRKIKKLWKPVLKVLACASAKHLAGMSISQLKEVLADGDSGDTADHEVEKGSSKIDVAKIKENLDAAVEKALLEHKTVKHSIADFKSQLTVLISSLGKISGVQLPLIIFVDELDRCRPDYAIQLLEGIKHLFGVPGVYFVIATNVQQLSESVKAVYGSGFEGKRYLNRFFDLQYSLREPSTEQFSIAIVKNMFVPAVENIIHGMGNLHLENGAKIVEHDATLILAYVFQRHADAFNLTLRDQLQVATILDAAFLALGGKKIHIFFIIFLAVMFQQDPVIFAKIAKTRKFTEGADFKNLNAGQGLVEFLDYGNGESYIRKLSVVAIATSYFNAMETSVKVLHERNTSEFPAILLRALEGKQGGGKFQAAYGNYFELIQHAGGFVETDGET